MGWRLRLAGAAVALSIIGGAGCQGTTELRNSELGKSAWESDDVHCGADGDCNAGEVCGDGVCQMKRCAEPNFRSVSPLGAVGYFVRDRELLVAAGTDIQGYRPDDRAFVRPNDATWSTGTGKVIDIAGGNLLGSRPEAFAFITEGADELVVQSSAQKKTIPIGFVPVALGSGDADADEIDDVVAASADAKVALCKGGADKCELLDAKPPAGGQGAPTGSFTVRDVAVGDVDGDGYAEAVLLTSRRSLIVVNFDSAKTGDTKVAEIALDKDLVRLAAGDVDGDGGVELVGVLDGWLGDELHTYSLAGDALTPKATLSTGNGAVDVAVGTFAGRDKTEIALLRDDSSIEMFALDSAGKLTSEYKGLLSNTGVTRLALADVNGDSPGRRVVGEPKLVAGSVVPIAALTLPPYSRSHSDGRSSVSMGRESSKGETKSEGMIFSVSAGLGFAQEISVFAKVVEVEVEAHYTQDRWKTRGATSTVTTSASFEIEAKPEMDGYDSGAVVLGCGCYHQYDYKVEDPAHKLGPDADGKIFSLYVPVAAQTSVWSTRRYNALVQALGGKLPKVTIPYQLGQVASYPSRAQTLEGAPIQEKDMVFQNPPTLRASDVAATTFELSVENEKTDESWIWRGGGASGSVGVFGVSVTGSLDLMYGKGYGVSVSESSSFSGTVPPLRNDPTTPEDELKLFGYSFTPIVYRHHYRSESGAEGAMFVLTYATDK